MGMTKTIDHEAEILAAAPHDLGCFEIFAERIVEEAAERGVDLVGAHDEYYDGMQIISRFHVEMIEGHPTRRCHCDKPTDYED